MPDRITAPSAPRNKYVPPAPRLPQRSLRHRQVGLLVAVTEQPSSAGFCSRLGGRRWRPSGVSAGRNQKAPCAGLWLSDPMRSRLIWRPCGRCPPISSAATWSRAGCCLQPGCGSRPRLQRGRQSCRRVGSAHRRGARWNQKARFRASDDRPVRCRRIRRPCAVAAVRVIAPA